jgi:hypothetical protein
MLEGFLAVLPSPFRKTGKIYPGRTLPRTSYNCILTSSAFGRATWRSHPASSWLELIPPEFLACYFLFFGEKRTRLDEESQKEQVNQNRQAAKWERKNERNRVGNKEFGRNSCIFSCDFVFVLASDGEMIRWEAGTVYVDRFPRN